MHTLLLVPLLLLFLLHLLLLSFGLFPLFLLSLVFLPAGGKEEWLEQVQVHSLDIL